MDMDKLFIKICGINDFASIDSACALHNGVQATHLGFVFYQHSPRFVELEHAVALTQYTGARVQKVGLFVNPDDALLEITLNNVDIDIIQLHGHETAQRVGDIGMKYNKKIMKALPIENVNSINIAKQMAMYCDFLLLDAPPSANTVCPGGNGVSFDRKLLEGASFACPWFLAGGINSGNVCACIQDVHPHGIDVSSGVEISPGAKSPKLIEAFLTRIADCLYDEDK